MLKSHNTFKNLAYLSQSMQFLLFLIIDSMLKYWGQEDTLIIIIKTALIKR